MANGGNFIKFDPEKILAASADIDRMHKSFRDCVSEIKTKAGALNGSWKGDGAASYSAAIDGLDARGTEIAEMLRIYCKELADASGIYKSGESAAKKKAEGLPTKGVFIM